VGRKSAFRRFGNDESGSAVIEHGLLACIFALVLVFAVAQGATPLLALRSLGAIFDGGEATVTTEDAQ
jgi:Flp pilus assembly pilin Flp